MKKTCNACGGELQVPANPTIRSFTCRYCKKEYRVDDRVHPDVLAARELRDGIGKDLAVAPDDSLYALTGKSLVAKYKINTS
jgi:hypothetical protein